MTIHWVVATGRDELLGSTSALAAASAQRMRRVVTIGRMVSAVAGADPAATHQWFYEASKWLADGLRAPLVETPGAHVPQATHPRALAETLRPILGKLAASQRFEA